MSLETREVLADAYQGRRRSLQLPMLTHGVEVDEHGREVRVLCRGVKLENLADAGSVDDPFQPPTCPRCLRAWQRVLGGEGA